MSAPAAGASAAPSAPTTFRAASFGRLMSLLADPRHQLVSFGTSQCVVQTFPRTLQERQRSLGAL